MSDSPAPKRRHSASERQLFRQQLVLIGRRLYHEEGAAAVTIRRVTAEAGVAPMTFYWYFEDKEALFLEVLEVNVDEAASCCREALEKVQRAPAGHGRASRRAVRAYFGAFLDYWLARPQGFRLMFLGDHANPRRKTPGLSPVMDSQRHFPDFEMVVSNHFPACCVKESRLGELRTLLSFQVLGFLFNAISLPPEDEAACALQRELVLGEIEHCIARWCAHECNNSGTAIA